MKQHGVMFKSGHAYRFKYLAFQHDPEPTYIHLYSFSGTHPKTNRQWRFHQGISLSYISRASRRAFAKDWAQTLKRHNGNVRFTWQTVQRKYPYLEKAVRRFFYSPSYYLSKIREIPFDENWEKNVVSTFSKDFSKKVKVSLAQKFRSLFGGRRSPKGKRKNK